MWKRFGFYLTHGVKRCCLLVPLHLCWLRYPVCFEYYALNCSEQTAGTAQQPSASGEAGERDAGEGLFTSKRLEQKNKNKTHSVRCWIPGSVFSSMQALHKPPPGDSHTTDVLNIPIFFVVIEDRVHLNTFQHCFLTEATEATATAWGSIQLRNALEVCVGRSKFICYISTND